MVRTNLASLPHLHSGAGSYRTFLFCLDILLDKSVIRWKDIYRLSGLCINHRPNALAVAIHFSSSSSAGDASANLEITGCEILHGILHPCLHEELVIRLGHLCHLNGKTTQYPSTMARHAAHSCHNHGRCYENRRHSRDDYPNAP